MSAGLLRSRSADSLAEPLILRTAIGTDPHLMPLWRGDVSSTRVRLELVEVKPLSLAFRQMIRNQEFDLCEMALVSQAMAHAYAKPITALPVPVWRHFHHGSLLCRNGSPITVPADLAGGRIGVRSYSQTSGVWARGILETEHGLDPDSVTWVTLEDSHVPEYQDPANVVRAAEGRSLSDLLSSGEVGAIMGLREGRPDEVRTVIPDAEAAARQWSERTGIVPVNHVLAVKTDLLSTHEWLADEITSLFERARLAASAAAPRAGELNGAELPYGLASNRASIELLLEWSARQRLTPRRFTVEEIFAGTAATSDL
jgi:4,5-dihydroxyphthalate decarboxylase